MAISLGAMDKWIVFQRRIGTQEQALGSTSYEWVNIEPGSWAEVYELLGSERISEGLNLSTRGYRITCRFRDDLTEDMRVVHGGRFLKISRGPAERGGRRQYTQMVCEVLSTEGVEA